MDDATTCFPLHTAWSKKKKKLPQLEDKAFSESGRRDPGFKSFLVLYTLSFP
jgi:hypothetical protein